MQNYPYTLHVRLNVGCKIGCQQDDNKILRKLPNKRQQVSKEDVSQSQILAEAIPQPRQMQ